MTEPRSNLLPTWFRSWQRDAAELLEHHSSQSILRRPFQFNVTVHVLYVLTAVTYSVVNLRYEVRTDTISFSQLSQVNSHFPPLSGFLVQLHSSKVNIIVTVLRSTSMMFKLVISLCFVALAFAFSPLRVSKAPRLVDICRPQ